ncbi:MAG: hypothetical protein JWO38_7478 [Gemmataceae bacterium]|nr:hypothetical protein [Gemmataceae bacterium]
MTDRERLLATVLDTPADDTARLVLSDYLQAGHFCPVSRARLLTT